MSKTVNRPNYLIKGELQTDLPFISLAHVTISKEKKILYARCFFSIPPTSKFSHWKFWKKHPWGKNKKWANWCIWPVHFFYFYLFYFSRACSLNTRVRKKNSRHSWVPVRKECHLNTQTPSNIQLTKKQSRLKYMKNSKCDLHSGVLFRFFTRSMKKSFSSQLYNSDAHMKSQSCFLSSPREPKCSLLVCGLL